MGVLDAIGEFGQGFSQGAGQGLDLYQRFQDVKTKGEERQRKKAFEQRAIALAQDPKFKNDPIGLSSGLADAALDVGDFEGYDKWTQAANSARDLKVQKLGMSAFAKARVNPEAALSDMNEMFKTFGNNNSITSQRTPNGMRLNFNVDGQSYSTDYAAGDTDKFEHDIMSLMEGYVMKPSEVGQLEVNRSRADVERRGTESEIARREALLPTEIAENRATTQSALASAAAANQRAETERVTRPFAIDAAKQDIAYKSALTETALNPRTATPAPPSAEKLIDDLAATNNELGLGGGLGSDKLFLGGLASELQRADPNIGEGGSAYTAYALTQMPATQLAQLASMNTEDAAKAGVIKMPDGTSIPYSPGIVRALAKIISSATAEP